MLRHTNTTPLQTATTVGRAIPVPVYAQSVSFNIATSYFSRNSGAQGASLLLLDSAGVVCAVQPSKTTPLVHEAAAALFLCKAAHLSQWLRAHFTTASSLALKERIHILVALCMRPAPETLRPNCSTQNEVEATQPKGTPNTTPLTTPKPALSGVGGWGACYPPNRSRSAHQ